MNQMDELIITRGGEKYNVFEKGNFLYNTLNDIYKDENVCTCNIDEYVIKYWNSGGNRKAEGDGEDVMTGPFGPMKYAFKIKKYKKEIKPEDFIATSDDNLNKAAKTFLYLSYTKGNYTTVVEENPKPGRPFKIDNLKKEKTINDSIYHKLNYKNNEENLQCSAMFGKCCTEEEIEKAIKERYLMDFSDKVSFERIGVNLKPLEEWNTWWTNWFIISSKLIIQRGYRLQFEIKENFSPEDKDNLSSIFTYFGLDRDLV